MGNEPVGTEISIGTRLGNSVGVVVGAKGTLSSLPGARVGSSVGVPSCKGFTSVSSNSWLTISLATIALWRDFLWTV